MFIINHLIYNAFLKKDALYRDLKREVAGQESCTEPLKLLTFDQWEKLAEEHIEAMSFSINPEFSTQLVLKDMQVTGTSSSDFSSDESMINAAFSQPSYDAPFNDVQSISSSFDIMSNPHSAEGLLMNSFADHQINDKRQHPFITVTRPANSPSPSSLPLSAPNMQFNFSYPAISTTHTLTTRKFKESPSPLSAGFHSRRGQPNSGSPKTQFDMYDHRLERTNSLENKLYHTGSSNFTSPASYGEYEERFAFDFQNQPGQPTWLHPIMNSRSVSSQSQSQIMTSPEELPKSGDSMQSMIPNALLSLSQITAAPLAKRLFENENENFESIYMASDCSPTTEESPHSASSFKFFQSGEKKVHQCRTCLRYFSRPEHLRRHMMSHTGERPHMCQIEGCKRSFARYDNLLTHMRKTHGMFAEQQRDSKRNSPAVSETDVFPTIKNIVDNNPGLAGAKMALSSGSLQNSPANGDLNATLAYSQSNYFNEFHQ